jgi:cell division septation protein DedD
MTAKLLLILAALFAPLEPISVAWNTDASSQHDRVATVQLDLLPDPDSAERVAAEVRSELAGAGLEQPVLVEAVAGEPDLPVSYRVVVGPFAGFEDAERARTELEAVGLRGFVREFEPLVGC